MIVDLIRTPQSKCSGSVQARSTKYTENKSMSKRISYSDFVG